MNDPYAIPNASGAVIKVVPTVHAWPPSLISNVPDAKPDALKYILVAVPVAPVSLIVVADRLTVGFAIVTVETPVFFPSETTTWYVFAGNAGRVMYVLNEPVRPTVAAGPTDTLWIVNDKGAPGMKPEPVTPIV